MSSGERVLLDVNILSAYGWQQYPFHADCSLWIDTLPGFATCPITELGFMSVSMSPAFRAGYEETATVLAFLTQSTGVHFIPCDLPVFGTPVVLRYKDTTDACLVGLAAQNS